MPLLAALALAAAMTAPARASAADGGAYVSPGGGNVRVALGMRSRTAGVPSLAEAHGLVRNWRREGSVTRFEFSGYYQPFFRLRGADHCRVTIDGRPATPAREAGTLRFDTPAVEDAERDRAKVEVHCV
ncbi:hypothetical protein ACKI2N_031110 [Cupriavidus sp. 30B13]|uniref:hypothetical protein n=1 Tax=Cupriavidus sp. 30B13 TaxID=3384241 RepID=UPI003B901EE3